MRNVLLHSVDIDSISESGSSKFGDNDDDNDVILMVSVISRASNQDKDAQTSSSVSSFFVSNDGPSAKAWNAASSFFELLLHISIGQNIILMRHFSVWSLQKLIATEISFEVIVFHFSAGPDPRYYLNKKITSILTKKLNVWTLTISLTTKRVYILNALLAVPLLIMRLRTLEILVIVTIVMSQCSV